MTKKMFKIRDCVCGHISFRGEISFEELKKFIQRSEHQCWWGLDFSDYERTGKLYYYRNRPETDLEYSERLLKEEQAKKERRNLYEELKKEFEKENFDIRQKITNVFGKHMFVRTTAENIFNLQEELAVTLEIPLEAIKIEHSPSGLSCRLAVTVNDKTYELVL